VIGAISLDYEVEIVRVSIFILPLYLLATSRRASVFLVVQIESFAPAEVFKLRKHYRLK
jgi:hypothetical protein